MDATRCPTHRRAKQRNWSEYRQQKMARQMKLEQPYCSYCGTPGTEDNPLTIDHVIPIAHGGTNARTNKTVACAKCNRAKSDKVASVRIRKDPPLIIG